MYPAANGNFNGVFPNANETATVNPQPNPTQDLLYNAYQQLNEAQSGRQQAIANYQELSLKYDTQVSALKEQVYELKDKHEAQIVVLKDKHEAKVLALKEEIDSLKEELRTARANADSRLSSTRSESQPGAQSTVGTLAPSDSVSRLLEHLPQGPEKPADRPDEYPRKILWTLIDAQNDPDIPLTQSNKSRPPMHHCIREADGSMVSSATWKEVRASAKRAIGFHLAALKLKPDEFRVRTVRSQHMREWMQCINYLEQAHPVVALCAGHWKAEHILSLLLTTDRSTADRKKKKALAGTGPDKEKDDGEDFGDEYNNPGSDDEEDGNNDNINLKDSQGKKRSAPHSDEPNNTKKTKTLHQSTSLAKEKDTVQGGIAIKKTNARGPRKAKPIVAENDGQSKKQSQKPAVSLEDQLNRSHTNNPKTSQAGGNSSTTDIDVSFIRVQADSAALRDEFLQQKTPILHAIALLDAMVASPDFKSSEPSANVTAFLARIETADPNSCEIEEDDTNESWGHWQFTAGSLTIANVIQDWASVGNVKMAYKLLAATVRTCKVARHICYERNITPTGFLSDAYLINLVEALWVSWTAAGGPHGNIVKGKAAKTPKQKAAPPMADDVLHGTDMPLPSGSNNPPTNITTNPEGPDNALVMMKPLQVFELKEWIESYNGSTALKRKEELIRFIVETATIPTPSEAEISAIVIARKAGKTLKTA